MSEFWSKLEGKKTYLLAAAAIVYLFGGSMGWWPVDERVLGILGFGGLASLRAGISKGGMV